MGPEATGEYFTIDHPEPDHVSVLEHRDKHRVVPPSDVRRHPEHHRLGSGGGYYHHGDELELRETCVRLGNTTRQKKILLTLNKQSSIA